MGPLWGGGWVLWGCYGVPAWVLWGGSAGTQPPPQQQKRAEHVGSRWGRAATAPPMGAHGNSAPYGPALTAPPMGAHGNSTPYRRSTHSAPCGSTREQRPLWA